MSKAFLYGVGGGGSPNLLEKTFTENGTYNATSEGYDGYNPVTVNVAAPEPTGYVRPTGVPNGEDIIANAPDIEQGGIIYKPIYYICAMDTFDSITFSKTATGSATGADAYVFSDEPSTLYVGDSVAHTFDRSLDFATDKEWNCRYIIMYATAANKASASGITVNLYNYRATFEFISASETLFASGGGIFTADTASYNSKAIEFIDLTEGSFVDNTISTRFCNGCSSLVEAKLPYSLTTINSGYFCSSCYSLKKISALGITSITGDFSFQNCWSLEVLNLPELTGSARAYFCNECSALVTLNLPKLTSTSEYFLRYCYSLVNLNLDLLQSVGHHAFNSCYSLKTLSLPEFTPNTGASNFCAQCNSLEVLYTPKLRTMSGSSMCSSTYRLGYIDFSNGLTSFISTTTSTLPYCRYIKLPTHFDISDCNFTGATGYPKSLDWLNNELPTKLKDNSGGTAKTMTLGAANIALIGTTAAAIIAAKNWTIA